MMESKTVIIQQLREATPFGEVPRFMHRDNDGLHGKGASMFLKALDVEEVRSAFRSPWQNPYIERFFGASVIKCEFGM